MVEIVENPTAPTLYTCEIDRGSAKVHPCRKAHEALDEAGIEHDTVISDRNRPFGIGSKGTRPEIKELSGQEKLPVLQLPDGTVISGSGKIKKWAQAQGS